MMIIVGITGTLGAGKGTIVEYLTEKYNYKHFSVREFITKELERRHLPVNRDTMTETANELRAANSPSYIVEQLFEQAKSLGQNCIIESIRTQGEVESLRKKGNFLLFAVDADPKLRYQRVINRKSETDNVSFETFLENEQREMISKDPNKQNISWCVANADYTFANNLGKEELFQQVEVVLTKIKQQ